MRLLRNSYVWLALGFLLALFFLVYPVYVIRPFRHQGAQELQVALAVKRWANLVAIVCATVAVSAGTRVWFQRRGWLPRSVAAVVASLTIAVCLLMRVNIYEKMFHPLENPTFASVADTKLADVEQVLAIRVDGAARAYPIRILSYHHVVNDVAGGLPVVATY